MVLIHEDAYPSLQRGTGEIYKDVFGRLLVRMGGVRVSSLTGRGLKMGSPQHEACYTQSSKPPGAFRAQ